MLTLVTPLRAVLVVFVVTVAIAARPSRPPPGQWQIGTLVRGSLHRTDDGGSFILERRVGSRCAAPRIEVHYHGELNSTVCEGVTIAVQGDGSHGELDARSVDGFHDGHYDRCWQLRCDDNAYDRCRDTDPYGRRQRFE